MYLLDSINESASTTDDDDDQDEDLYDPPNILLLPFPLPESNLPTKTNTWSIAADYFGGALFDTKATTTLTMPMSAILLQLC